MEPKFPISFVKSVAPSATETEEHTFQRSGTITNLFVPTYAGHEGDFRYTFKLEKSDGGKRDLVSPLGSNYISGNGEVFDLDLRVDYKKGDKLIIAAENNDTTYTYTANAFVETDYAGGLLAEIGRKLGIA